MADKWISWNTWISLNLSIVRSSLES
jgi:hypothetical protein